MTKLRRAGIGCSALANGASRWPDQTRSHLERYVHRQTALVALPATPLLRLPIALVQGNI